MDVDRLLLISKLKINRTLKERHYFSFVSNILHGNVDDKQNIAFPLLVGILISTRVRASFYPSLYSISSLWKLMNGHNFLLTLFGDIHPRIAH